MPFLSIVTTLYQSEHYVEEFYQRTISAASKISNDYEIIFVDDGSTDNSCGIAKKIIEKDKKVRLVELSRNFGHHKAIIVGLEHCKGDYVFLVDSDLEEDPDLLLTFYGIMQKDLKNTDVVYGYLEDRRGTYFGKLFYKLFNFIGDIFMHEGTILVRVMKKSYVNNLLQFKEKDVFILGLMQLAGFKQVAVPVHKADKGKSTYTFLKKLSLAADAIFSFSNKPLLYICVLGFIMSIISFLCAAYLILKRLFGSSEVLLGWTSMMVSLYLIGGLIIFSIGIVGIYIGRTYLQVKNRPNTIIRNIYN